MKGKKGGKESAKKTNLNFECKKIGLRWD